MELPPTPPSVVPAPKPKRPLWQLIAAGTAGLLVLCCLGSVVIGALAPKAPAQASGPTVQAVFSTIDAGLKVDATDVPIRTQTAAPTETAAPEPTATQPPEPTAPPTVGSRVEAGDQALTVMGVSRATKLGEFFKAGAGKVYVVVDVVIEATNDKADYNPFYFKVKDSEGREYNVGIGADDSLKSGELAAGEKVRGNVAFEVPEGATGLVLNYKPLILFDNRDAIRIALPDA